MKYRFVFFAPLLILLFSFGGPEKSNVPLVFRKDVSFVIGHCNGENSYSNLDVHWNAEVLKVKNENGRISSEVKIDAIREEGEIFNSTVYYFASDDKAFYVDLRNLSWGPKGDTTYFNSGSLLAYPYKMKVGDSLESGWYNWKCKDDDLKGKISHRYVKSLDTLDLPLGRIPAFRITSLDNFEMFNAADKKSQYTNCNSETEWFNPELGIVIRNVYMFPSGRFREKYFLYSYDKKTK